MATNILPSFLTGGWYLDDTCTLISSSDYDYSFTCTSTWVGVALSMPTEWCGKTLKIGCESISSNGGFYIQDTSDWSDIAVITSTEKEVTVTISSDVSATMCLQAPETTGTVSITGLYVYDVSESGESSGSTDTTIIRPTSATGTSWSNLSYIYDTDSTTLGSVSIKSSNYTNRQLTTNWGIEATDSIESATLTIKAKGSSTTTARIITLYVDINGDSSNRVMSQELTTTATEYTVDITSYVNSISTITVLGYIGSTTSTTLSIYDMYITITKSSGGSESGGEEETVTDNILPTFDTWTQESGLSVSSISDYDITFTSPSAWTGIYLYGTTIFSSGDVITLGCSGISSNAEFSIADANSNVIATISSSNLTTTVTVDGTSPFDIWITSSDTNEVTVTGAYLTKGSSGEETEVVAGDTYIQLGNRLIGYKKVTNEEVNSNATIVSSASELTSAISNASAGTIIYVRSGTYTFSSGLTISVSGSSSSYITIKNYPNETPIISGSSITFSSGVQYINFEGFLIKDLTDLDWGACLTVSSGCSYINLRNLEITNIKCTAFDSSSSNGCNPLVLYGDGSTAISNCLIENCYVHDCDTGWSEAITLNGNVTDCVVRNCCVDNNCNIGIDLAGNFSWTGTAGDDTNQARNTIVENNLVMNCQSPYATSAGLYCDGGRDNTFRYNVVYNAQCGIELGAEESGATVQNFNVYGNLIIDSGRSIGVGGYQSTSATHQNTYIYNNTIICGNSNDENYGLYLERTSNLYFVNNIVYGASNTELYATSGNASSITLSGNCWYNGTKPSSDTTGITSDPLFKNNTGTISGDYNLESTSPCINNGQTVTDSTLCGTVDINNNSRVNGTIDIGAFEYYDGTETEDSVSITIGAVKILNIYVNESKIINIYLGSTKIF